jgi:tetratricopeptide (TPR) repeat protein
LGRVGDDSEALAARLRDSAVRAEVVAALDDWASLTQERERRAWLLEVARGADPDSTRDRLRQPELWGDGAGLTRCAREVRVAELSPQLATALGRVLGKSGGEAAPLLTAAQARFPSDFWLNFHLALTLHEAKQWDEALGYYRVALALRPRAGAAHTNLGVLLYAKGRRDEAIGHFRQALRLDPEHATAHCNLGNALYAEGRRDEAVDHYQQALRLDPKSAPAHYNLGNTLKDKGRWDEAIQHYSQTITLDPKAALAHHNLGVALYAKGRVEEAIQHYRQAISLDPKDALAHYNLGNALYAKGQVDDAIQACRQAIALDPKHAYAHSNLGNALYAKGRFGEAIGHYREALRLAPTHALAHHNLGNALFAKGRLNEAIGSFQEALRLDPKHPYAHYNLGNALFAKGRFGEAIAEFRKALRQQPDHAEAHCNLGHALQRQGHFAEAVACLKRGHELGSKNPRWPYPSGQWLREAKHLAALENRLPAVLQGKHRPANAAEALQFAQLCGLQKRYAAAARLHTAAFTANPRLAADLQAAHRYNAACFAALAGAAKGADTALLDDKERARWRKQALDWLRADLAAWARAMNRALVQQTLKHWQSDSDLASVRGRGAMAQLPPAERAGWRRFWSDVAELLRKTPGAK